MLLFGVYVAINFLFQKAKGGEDPQFEKPSTLPVRTYKKDLVEKSIFFEETPYREEQPPTPLDIYTRALEQERARVQEAAKKLQALNIPKKNILVEKQKTKAAIDIKRIVNSSQELKEAFILKEVLSKPLAYTNYKNRRLMR